MNFCYTYDETRLKSQLWFSDLHLKSRLSISTISVLVVNEDRLQVSAIYLYSYIHDVLKYYKLITDVKWILTNNYIIMWTC